MSLVEKPLENIFADELTKGIQFYDVCRGHRIHDNNSSNNFPFIRFYPREQLWDKDLPEDDYNLESMVLERFYDDLEYICEGYPELKGFEITTDLNGYRMLLTTPIYDLEQEREEKAEELEEEMNCIDPDVDAMNDLADRIKEIDQELVECAVAYNKFCEIVESLKGYFDDHVVVVDDEGRFDFVHKEWYEDMKEEYNWRIWDEEAEEEAEKSAEEEAEQEMVEVVKSLDEPLITHVSKEGMERMKNSMR